MFHLPGEGPFAFVLDYLFMFFFFVHFGLFFLFTLGPPHHSYDTSFPHSLKKPKVTERLVVEVLMTLFLRGLI